MNPFNPSFGRVPEIFLDRNEIVRNLVENLSDLHSPYQTTLVYGLRGTGKTVFLTDISKTMQKKSNWIVVNMSLGMDLFSTLIQSIYNKMPNKLKLKMNQINGISFTAFGSKLDFDSKELLTPNYQVLLESVLKILKDNGISVIIKLDEVNSTEELRKFVAVYQILVREEYHLSMIMTGLPDRVSKLQNDKVLTFLLRSARIVLEPLNLLSVKNSYAKVFADAGMKIDNQTLNRLTKMTQGYAYAFQLLGYLIWQKNPQVIDENLIDEIIDEFKNQLYRNVYLKIYQELSKVDKQFVNVMAELDVEKCPISEIQEKMGKKKNYISMYRRRLIDSQVIKSVERGYVSFTLPYFTEFINENRELYGI